MADRTQRIYDDLGELVHAEPYWATAEIERLRLERDLWRQLAEARSGILVAYRVGGRVPGKHIDAARDAERRLSELEDDR